MEGPRVQGRSDGKLESVGKRHRDPAVGRRRYQFRNPSSLRSVAVVVLDDLPRQVNAAEHDSRSFLALGGEAGLGQNHELQRRTVVARLRRIEATRAVLIGREVGSAPEGDTKTSPIHARHPPSLPSGGRATVNWIDGPSAPLGRSSRTTTPDSRRWVRSGPVRAPTCRSTRSSPGYRLRQPDGLVRDWLLLMVRFSDGTVRGLLDGST